MDNPQDAAQDMALDEFQAEAVGSLLRLWEGLFHFWSGLHWLPEVHWPELEGFQVPLPGGLKERRESCPALACGLVKLRILRNLRAWEENLSPGHLHLWTAGLWCLVREGDSAQGCSLSSLCSGPHTLVFDVSFSRIPIWKQNNVLGLSSK